MVKAWASGLARTVSPCVPDTAEVQGAADGIRCACVRDLSMAGAYLVLPDPFSKGASIGIKIRTQKEFLQADCRPLNARARNGCHVSRRESPIFDCIAGVVG